MIQLLIILYGEEVARRRWRGLLALGLVWIGIGTFLFVDALDGKLIIAAEYFTIPLLLDAVVTLAAAYAGPRSRRPLRLAKSGFFVAISLLILCKPWGSGVTIGILVGTVLVLDASWRAFSAYMVRFAGWRRTIALAAFEFLMGAWSFVPWPSQWQGEVGMDVGSLIIVAGASVVGVARRLKRLPPGAPISRVLTEGWPAEDAAHEGAGHEGAERGKLTVHVWTPTGGLAPLRHTVERYIAATDEQGFVSTGHSALEAGDFYISHYPAEEPDRSAVDFSKALRATKENDLAGRWQPSYAVESAGWCASTVQVEFHGLKVGAVRSFFATYRQDATYNLTSRNCSTVVAKALDLALEGAFAGQAGSPRFFLRLILQPELWAAGMVRERALTMTWTPGLVLDYARALSALLEWRTTTSAAKFRHAAS